MRIIKVLFNVLLAIMLSASFSFAANLSIVDAGSGKVNIVADDTSNLLGAAFTVTYDGAILAEPTIESTYFDTFVKQFVDPGYIALGEKGLDSKGWVSGFESPLVSNNPTGKVMLAAACHTAKPGENVTIFSLTFETLTGVSPSASTITIVPTELNNPSAGYDPNDGISDEVDPLVGAGEGESFVTLETAATLKSNPPKVTIDMGNEISVPVDFVTGWNMFALPVDASTKTISALFPAVQPNTVYKFEGGGYILLSDYDNDVLELGEGYWVEMPSDQQVTFVGADFKNYQKTLTVGWHMQGGVNGTATPSPSDLVFYKFENGGYVKVSDFIAGEGYWVEITQDNTVFSVDATQ